jgi:hypothetical protein
MNYTCPVCGYNKLNYPPRDFTICSSCGTEFGHDDLLYSLSELTLNWIQGGMRWWSNNVEPPPGWDPAEQLRRILEPVSTSQTTIIYKELTLRGSFIRIRSADIEPEGQLFPVWIGAASSVNRTPATI